ncbi:glycosyltransferase family 2 protein [Estrella lausannensis]|uniref:Putative lipopolysaccharide core biosynthesis glycosyltransferase WaaE n=1 Tax=Estrella lausannensis TaxID=483423 RepID=A0A0H5DNR3_9BACT|nr:glycosyltransferase family 2 protein [Estrella lausannensis]CRX37453.1 Putative lipopolysaccharide core biosynthesis glycosyltransferase WaaE [Estrella lausannensis]
MENLKNISVTILVKNGERYLTDVLEATKDFGQVVVYDNGSLDKSKEIAASFPNVLLLEGPFFGFGPTHNLVSEKADHDWIFSLDCDEVMPRELVKELDNLALDKDTVYAVSRKNYFQGKWIRWCGWHPDFQYRLYHRQKTSFTEAAVHESVKTEGLKIVRLRSSLIHYPYQTYSDFLQKMQHYTELFAKERMGKVSSSKGKALRHGLFAFFKSYVLKRGFLGGFQGFYISLYNAETAFYKYLKLEEKNRELLK